MVEIDFEKMKLFIGGIVFFVRERGLDNMERERVGDGY